MERLLKSRYKIGKKISENSYSATYQGSYLSNDKALIIKIYKRAALNSFLIKTIRHKIKAFSSINHHGIAKVIDGDYGWQGFYYVREFVEGKSLRKILDIVKTVELDKAVQIIQDVCEALAIAHKNGAIHGALSPNNIIISTQKIVKLTDFVVEGQIKESLPQKASHVAEGANYLSPEEIIGKAANFSSDIYSTGLILYEMLAGRLPFADKSKALLLALDKIKSKLAPISSLNPGVPKIVEDIIAKALQRDPLLRFANINELATSLKNKSIISTIPIQDLPLLSYDTDSKKTKTKEKEHILLPQKMRRSFSSFFGGWLIRLLMLIFLAGMLFALVSTLMRA